MFFKKHFKKWKEHQWVVGKHRVAFNACVEASRAEKRAGTIETCLKI